MGSLTTDQIFLMDDTTVDSIIVNSEATNMTSGTGNSILGTAIDS